MLGNERGSASIIFAVVVLPMLFILAMIGIELTQFFSMREEVRRIVDSEAKQSLGRPYPPEYVARRIRSRAQALRPYIEVSDVEADASGNRAEVVARGTFNGAISRLVGILLGQGLGGVSFAISSAARRTNTAALILIDRTVAASAPMCEDRNLRLRASIASNLARDLRSAGVMSVRIGVLPGEQREIDLLAADDPVPRCSGFPNDNLFKVAAIKGTQGIRTDDPVDLAYLATRLLLLDEDATNNEAAGIEQRAIIMIAPPFEVRSNAIPITFSLLADEAVRQETRISAVGIVVGGDGGGSSFGVKSESERGGAKYLHVSEDEAAGSDLRVALVNHIQGQTFIAR